VENILQALQTQKSMGLLIQEEESMIVGNKLEVTSDMAALKVKFVDPVLALYVKAVHSSPNIFAIQTDQEGWAPDVK
jgi:hypothetical protein